MFTPETWGRFSLILTSIFFNWVGEKPPTRNGSNGFPCRHRPKPLVPFHRRWGVAPGKIKKKMHIPEAYFFDGSEIWLTTLDVLKYSQITGYFIISTGEFSAFLEPSTATRVSPEPIVINSRFDTGPLKKWPKINGCFRKWWYPQNTPKWSFLVGKPMVVGYHHFSKPPIWVTGVSYHHYKWRDEPKSVYNWFFVCPTL